MKSEIKNYEEEYTQEYNYADNTLIRLPMCSGKASMIIDVRTQNEWDLGHIDRAVHLPLDSFESVIESFVIDKKHQFIFTAEAVIAQIMLYKLCKN